MQNISYRRHRFHPDIIRQAHGRPAGTAVQKNDGFAVRVSAFLVMKLVDIGGKGHFVRDRCGDVLLSLGGYRCAD